MEHESVWAIAGVSTLVGYVGKIVFERFDSKKDNNAKSENVDSKAFFKTLLEAITETFKRNARQSKEMEERIMVSLVLVNEKIDKVHDDTREIKGALGNLVDVLRDIKDEVKEFKQANLGVYKEMIDIMRSK